MKSYLNFVKLPRLNRQVTDKWVVRSVSTGGSLGRIMWFNAWRKYCFFPDPDALFDSSCLTEIAEFCRESTITQHTQTQTIGA